MSDYHYTIDNFDFGNLTVKIDDVELKLDDDILNDAISIQPSKFNCNSPAYTVSTGSGGSGTYSAGIAGAQGSNYTFSTSGWNGVTGFSSSNPTVVAGNKGIEITNGADITINGKSLSNFMDRVESRLGILQPKPELLEKFEALKQAYEHYKTLEALCTGDIPTDPNAR